MCFLLKKKTSQWIALNSHYWGLEPMLLTVFKMAASM